MPTIDTKKISLLLKHILALGLFISYEVSYVMLFGSRATVWDLIPFYLLAIAFFYLNAHFVMPLWDRISPGLTILVIGLEIASYLLMISLAEKLVEMIPHRLRESYILPPKFIEPVKNAYRAIYILGLSIAYWLGRKTVLQAREMHRLRMKALEQEVAYLRAQANPHLLFNVLGDLYEDMREQSAMQAVKVSLLVENMHYAYRPPAIDFKSLLSEEIDQVKNYIALQQTRHDDPLAITLEEPPGAEITSVRFPPIILLTLVDNIFKYGVVTDKSDPARITITYKSGELAINTHNRIRGNAGHQLPYHIGLANTQRRLEYAYPGQHHLLISKEARHFIINLFVRV